MAKRNRARMIEVKGSHLPLISQPGLITELTSRLPDRAKQLCRTGLQ